MSSTDCINSFTIIPSCHNLPLPLYVVIIGGKISYCVNWDEFTLSTLLDDIEGKLPNEVYKSLPNTFRLWSTSGDSETYDYLTFDGVLYIVGLLAHSNYLLHEWYFEVMQPIVNDALAIAREHETNTNLYTLTGLLYQLGYNPDTAFTRKPQNFIGLGKNRYTLELLLQKVNYHVPYITYTAYKEALCTMHLYELNDITKTIVINYLSME